MIQSYSTGSLMAKVEQVSLDLVLILRGTWMSEPNLITIHAVVADVSPDQQSAVSSLIQYVNDKESVWSMNIVSVMTPSFCRLQSELGALYCLRQTSHTPLTKQTCWCNRHKTVSYYINLPIKRNKNTKSAWKLCPMCHGAPSHWCEQRWITIWVVCNVSCPNEGSSSLYLHISIM